MGKSIALSQVACSARRICFDRLIRDFIRRFPNGTVINIGCGLDSVYDRVNNETILWYDISLQDLIKPGNSFYTGGENRNFITVSFSGSPWYKKLVTNGSILIVANGVFYHFNEKTVRKFLAGISHFFPQFEMIFDVASPWGVRIANRHLKKSGCNNDALLKWGLKNVSAILSLNPRFRLLGKYYAYKQEGICMSLKNRILGFISDAFDINYMVHIRLLPDYKHLL